MNFLFMIMCWVMGIVGTTDDNHAERIRARAKCRERIRARARCREIRVKRHEVVVKFTCQEDAELFAEDLKNFVRE